MSLETQREALFIEALGDLGKLLQHVDQLRDTLPAEGEAVAARIAASTESAVRRVEAAHAAALADMKTTSSLSARAAAAVAEAMGRSERRSLVGMLGSGLAGGLVAGLVLMMF